MVDRQIERLLAKNRSAVAAFASAAAAIADAAWHVPIAAEKWSPAQHVDHVARAYDAGVLDMEEHRAMALIGTPRQRRWWRLAGLSMVRWLGRLPHGAPAPREIRPARVELRSPAQLLAQLDERVRSFELAVRKVAVDDPRRGFTHPYFGTLSLRDGLRLMAVHTRHHTRALANVARSAAGEESS